MMEKDPHGKKPFEPGAKMDAGKSPVRSGLLEFFPHACKAVADMTLRGSGKYNWDGWSKVQDGVKRYGDAEARHICDAAIEGETDKNSGGLHAASEAWNALARLELMLREKKKVMDYYVEVEKYRKEWAASMRPDDLCQPPAKPFAKETSLDKCSHSITYKYWDTVTSKFRYICGACSKVVWEEKND